MQLIVQLPAQMEVLILTTALFMAAGLLALFYLIVRPKGIHRSGEVADIYLSGESERIVRSIDIPSSSLLWGLIIGWGRKLYRFLRDEMHNGILSDWASYMALWMCISLLISGAAIIAYFIYGGR